MAKPLLDDELWASIEPLIPVKKRRKKHAGRLPKEPRRCLEGILFVLRTGIQWEMLPAQFGCCGMTCWRRLRDWQSAGVWDDLHRLLLAHLNAADQIDWTRAVIDSVNLRAVGGAN
jgi:transposase